jgi:hypothetical protein
VTAGLIWRILEWFERWLVEHVGEHLGEEGLVWLLTQRYVMLGMDFPIWV